MKLRMTTNVKLKIDNREWKRMQTRLTRGADKMVRVGWWATQHSSGVPTAMIAAWNEEGHMNGGMFAGTYTPPRPFMRLGFIPLAVTKILPKFYNDIHLIATGKSTWTTLHKRLSVELMQGLQETILSWDTPSNSPVTVALKGFNDPLMSTGNMYDSVKTRIVRRAGA